MNPIFIIGCHKSGTSLLRSLFDGHPDLNTIPIESHFFEHLMMPHQYPLRQFQMSRNISFFNSLHNQLSEYQHSGSEVADVDLRGKINPEISKTFEGRYHDGSFVEKFIMMTKHIMSAVQDSIYDVNKRTVEKSVENLHFSGYLKQLFPKASFVHIVRNPYANLVALRKFKTKLNYPSLPELVESIFQSFYYQELNSQLLSDYYTIQYETLVEQPDRVMRDMAQKLKLRFNETLVRPTLLGKEWKGNSSVREDLGGQVVDMQHQWKDEILPIEARYINHKCKNVLSRWNYKSISSGSIWKPGPGEHWKTYIRNRLYTLFLD